MSKKPTMASQLVYARKRISELEHQAELLHDEEFEASVRDQIESLATDADTTSAPTTPEQWRRCLQGILRGDDWRFGTWK